MAVTQENLSQRRIQWLCEAIKARLSSALLLLVPQKPFPRSRLEEYAAGVFRLSALHPFVGQPAGCQMSLQRRLANGVSTSLLQARVLVVSGNYHNLISLRLRRILPLGHSLLSTVVGPAERLRESIANGTRIYPDDQDEGGMYLIEVREMNIKYVRSNGLTVRRESLAMSSTTYWSFY